MAKHTYPQNSTPDNNDTPAFSSRIIRVYLDYLQKHYPDIDPAEVITPAGIKPAEVDDPGFWYSQNQTVQMHEIMVAKTGNPDLSRTVGRYTARSRVLGTIRQFVLTLVSPLSVYLRAQKIYRLMSRGAQLKVEPLTAHKIRITATPVPGIDEARFQCENRLGSFEGLASLFSDQDAAVKHTECLHNGGSRCEYLVSWQPTLASKLAKIKPLVFLGSALLAAALFFILPFTSWSIAVAVLTGLSMAWAILSGHFEKQELSKTLETHLARIKEPQTNADLMYNNALLIQKLGQETARIFDLETYLKKVMALMAKRLGFDRGAILLSDREGSGIRVAASFGYSSAEKQLLNGAQEYLAAPQYKRFAVTLFKEGKSILVNDLAALAEKIPSESYNFGSLLQAQACISVPIRYENKPMGILLVDNKTRKRTYYQSDVNLLEGIAGQIAASIVSSRSFARLQESEAKFRMVFQTSPDAFSLNRYNDDVYVDVNEGFLAMTGYSREEILGNTPEKLRIWESNSRRREAAIEIDRTGSLDNFETRLRLKSGQLKDGQMSAKVIVLDQQRYILSITRDMTKMKRMETERNKLEGRLRHSARMESIGTLAGGIAHDFNNLMMGIQGNIDLIVLDAEPTGHNYQRMKNITQYVESGARLTRQLLGFAQAGKYDARPTDLGKLAGQASRMFARTRKEVSVHLEAPENTWTVEVDRGQVEQVFLNLFVNAWQAMPGGGDLWIRIENRLLDDEKARLLGTRPGPYVLTTVRDNGVGMNATTLEKIFDPFFTTRGMGRGTGLGLASAYGIIKNHGGAIEASSKEGAGATFRFYLPASAKHVSDIPEKVVPVEKGTGKILLVDDEQMIIEVAQELLEHLGYDVITAGSGKKAVALLADNYKKIDLVILDLIMPGMGGGETFDALRSIAPGMKVLLSSGYALEGEASEILERGCNGFIQKPYNLSNLSEKVRAILDEGN